MPKRLSPAEKIRRERERIAKQKLREQAKQARHREQLNRRALRKLTTLTNKASKAFENFAPEQDGYWGKSECKQLNIPTAAALMADAKRKAKTHYEQSKRELRLQKKMRTLFPMIENAWFDGMDSEEIQWVGRAIGTIVFDVPARYIGWRSESFHEAYIQAKKNGETLKPSPEHIYPRQFCGELLVYHMLLYEGIEFDQFILYVNVFRQIAHVLSAENHDMKGFQGRDTFVCPEHAYKLAGIHMVSTGDGEELLRIEDVAPLDVLEVVYGERLEELHKYNC